MDGADIDVESQRLIEQLLRAEADDRASRLVAERIQLDHVLRATQNPAADVIIHEPKPQDEGAASPRPPQDKAPAATVAVAAAERPPASEASRPRRRQTQRSTATNGSTQRKSSARQRADPAPTPSRVRERRVVQNALATAPRMVDGAIIISDSEDESADRRSPPATGQCPGKQKQKQKQPASQQPSAALAASRKTKPRRKRVLVISSDEEDGDGPAVAPANAVVEEVTKDDVQPPPPIPPVDNTLNNAVDTGSLELPLPDAVVGPDVEMDGVDKEREAEQTPLDANVDHTDRTSQSNSKAAGKRRAEEQPPGHERAKRARSRHPIDASRSTPGASRRSRTVDPNRSSRARRPGGDASAKRSRAPPPAEPAQATCGICRDEFRITRNPIFESLRPGSSSALPPGLRLPCPGKHAYCLGCIQTVVRNKLDPENKDPNLVAFPIFCPECPRTKWPDGIPFNVAERILDLKDQQLWKSRRRMLHSTRTMWCPNPRCSQQVEADEALVKPNALCPACKDIMCVRCRVRWHKGMTCEEYQALPLTERAPEDAATILLANAEKWKQCPHCKMLVELTAGCNHMICRCGAHFCIKCAGEWDRNRGLCSQGCMLWDEEMILRVQEERAQAARVGLPGPAAGPAAGEPVDENVSHAQKLIPAPYELPKPLHLDYIGARRPPRPPPPPPPAPPAQPQPRRDMPKKAPRAVFNPLVAAAESLLAQKAKLDGFLQQLGLRPPIQSQSRPLPLVYDYEDDNYGDDGDGEDEDGDDDDDDGYDDNGEDLEWLFDEDAVSDQHWFTTNMLDEPFTCGYCEEDTWSLEGLQQHLLATEDHGVWACCGKFFQREIDLDRHQEAYPARFHRHVLKVCWNDD